MQSFYDFQGQINAMSHIFRQHVSNAEKINAYLKKMSPLMIFKIVRQLKEEYENIYNDSDDQQKLNSIKNTLNLAASEQATNLDSLFIELSEEINTYYKKQYFKIKKQLPFLLYCDICRDYVSNDRYTCQLHQSKCRKKKQRNLSDAPQRKILKKKADTIQKYTQRQELVKESVKQAKLQKNSQQKQSYQQGIITQKNKVSKSQSLKAKKLLKSKKALFKSISREFEKKFLPKIKFNQQQCFDEELSVYFSEEEKDQEMENKNNRTKGLEQLLSRNAQVKHQNNQKQDFEKNSLFVCFNKCPEDVCREIHNQFFVE